MEEVVKTKFEQTILANLTADGKLLDLEDKNIGPEEMRLLCEAEDLPSVEQPEPALWGVDRNLQRGQGVDRAHLTLPQPQYHRR